MDLLQRGGGDGHRALADSSAYPGHTAGLVAGWRDGDDRSVFQSVPAGRCRRRCHADLLHVQTDAPEKDPRHAFDRNGSFTWFAGNFVSRRNEFLTTF